MLLLEPFGGGESNACLVSAQHMQANLQRLSSQESLQLPLHEACTLSHGMIVTSQSVSQLAMLSKAASQCSIIDYPDMPEGSKAAVPIASICEVAGL